ncbi:MAG: hypothetical protein IJ877_06320 [Candidatus Gastranaerophilales bacterium]|nr:hypothetical protein [Candidatus Gastranaerophilales bacterium]
MQESLYDTVTKFQKERKINVEELEELLDSDIEEVVSLCKKACLKPKTDDMGNAYFTGVDVDVLRKMKELYSQARNTQKQLETEANIKLEAQKQEEDLVSPNQKVNFLTRAKSRIKSLPAFESAGYGIQNSLEKLENNLIEKFAEILSEKMDGFDEIIVELIRSKTENENLRAQVNDLNKQVFNLKKELALYTPLPFGFYTRKESEEL